MKAGAYQSATQTAEVIAAIDRRLLGWENEPEPRPVSTDCDDTYVNLAQHHVTGRIETLRQLYAEETANCASPERQKELEDAIDEGWSLQYAIGAREFATL